MENNYPKIRLGDISEITLGCSYPLERFPSDDLYEVNVVSEISTSQELLVETKYGRLTEREIIKYKFKKNDIVFKFRPSLKELGKVVMFDLDDLVINTSGFYRIRIINDYDSNYLENLLKVFKNTGDIARLATLGKRSAAINIADLQKLVIPCPPLDIQKQLVAANLKTN